MLNMEMKFLKKIVLSLEQEGITEYRIAKELGISQQLLQNMLGKGTNETPKGIRLKTLCRLRALCEKYKIEPKTWSKLGSELDKEFLTAENDL